MLTDALFTVFQAPTSQHLLHELDARWSLLEGAFEQRRDQSELANDIRLFYLQHGYERRPLTSLVPVLHGYQDGRCFYCGEVLVAGSIDVDHVIPRQILYHDEVWNLVLAHSFCNNQKSDLLPGLVYLEKLVARNERLIASTHPIRERIIQALGTTAAQRRTTMLQTYADAQVLIPTTWEGARGYNPATDPFYQRFVRSLNS